MKPLQCDNCGKLWDREDIEGILHIDQLEERVDPGELMPAGECPDCECLVHVRGKKVVTTKDVKLDECIIAELVPVSGRLNEDEMLIILDNDQVISISAKRICLYADMDHLGGDEQPIGMLSRLAAAAHHDLRQIMADEEETEWRVEDHCDGTGPHSGNEVRKAPIWGGQNLILCHACWRKDYDPPHKRTPWNELEVYDHG